MAAFQLFKAVESDGWASRTSVETHLNILHAQDVPTIIHVLLEVFVLDAGEREREKGEGDEDTAQPLLCFSP